MVSFRVPDPTCLLNQCFLIVEYEGSLRVLPMNPYRSVTPESVTRPYGCVWFHCQELWQSLISKLLRIITFNEPLKEPKNAVH